MDLLHTHLWIGASDFGWGAPIDKEMATHKWFITTEGQIEGKGF